MAKEYRAFHRVVPEYCHRYMYDGIVCDVPITNLLQSEIGMLIPGKSHSWDESRNSRVSIETLDFAQVRTSTCMIRVGSPAGARRGGDHRPDPADDGTLSPPAADQHSRQWRTQNGRVGRVWGIATGEAQRPSAPERRAGESPPPPVGCRCTIGRRRGRDGRVKRRAVAESPAPWCTCQNADVQRDGGT